MDFRAWTFAAVALATAAAAQAQERLVERMPTPFAENGAPVTLEIVVVRPPGTGPFPTIVFNHGSTGRGDKPARFRDTFSPGIVANFFNTRGWSVVFPQRRGRGKSDGLYDEGFEPDRSMYACNPRHSLPGLERAIQDLEVVVENVRARPDVDAKRIVVGGLSRGGILSLAYSSRHPDLSAGVVNFVGGWISDKCWYADKINTETFRASARYPGATIWLYGENDALYSMDHSRGNFNAFTAAGGHGVFHSYFIGPGANGHLLLSNPGLWEQDLSAFLDRFK